MMMRAWVFFSFLVIATPSGVVAGAPSEALITLDSICAMPESRNPKLPPGNPAPSTRRMAQLLAEMNEKLPPPAYMSDRIVKALTGELTRTTNLSERMKLLFKLGIEQTQAGRPDQGLNTFAADR